MPAGRFGDGCEADERDEECEPHPLRSPDRLAANAIDENKVHDAPVKSKHMAKPGFSPYLIEMQLVRRRIAAYATP